MKKSDLLIAGIMLVVAFILFFDLQITGNATSAGTINITIEGEVPEEPQPPSDLDGGGGGGGSDEVSQVCDVEWKCYEQEECRRYDDSLIGDSINESFASIIKEKCVDTKISLEDCGYKIWDCYDLNNCNDTSSRPEPWRICSYLDGEEGIFTQEFPYINILEEEKYRTVNLILIVLFLLIIIVLIYFVFILLFKLRRVQAAKKRGKKTKRLDGVDHRIPILKRAYKEGIITRTRKLQ